MIILSTTHADTGKFYVLVEQAGIRQEFKFDHDPTPDDLLHVSAELYRQHRVVNDSLFTRKVVPYGDTQSD